MRIVDLRKWIDGGDALIMANARRLIKAKKITSNGRLYSELFGTGNGTARLRCRELGLNPDSNATSYSMMMEFVRAAAEIGRAL